MSICWLLENDAALGKFSRYLLQGTHRSFSIAYCGPFVRPGPGWTVTGCRTLAKEEVPRKRSSGWSFSKRGPDMNYTKQGRDVSSLTLIPNEMIIVQHIQTTSRSSFHIETNMTSCSSIESFRQCN